MGISHSCQVLWLQYLWGPEGQSAEGRGSSTAPSPKRYHRGQLLGRRSPRTEVFPWATGFALDNPSAVNLCGSLLDDRRRGFARIRLSVAHTFGYESDEQIWSFPRLPSLPLQEGPCDAAWLTESTEHTLTPSHCLHMTPRRDRYILAVIKPCSESTTPGSLANICSSTRNLLSLHPLPPEREAGRGGGNSPRREWESPHRICGRSRKGRRAGSRPG